MTTSQRRLYLWLPSLIIAMTLAACVVGGIALRYVGLRLVAMTGEGLTLAATDIADKLDRLLFERHGDSQMMAQALNTQMGNRPYLTAYLAWMKRAYPAYLWLGVTDGSGRVVAATQERSLGKDLGGEPWFSSLRQGGERVYVQDIDPYRAGGHAEEQGAVVAFASPILGPQGEFLGAVRSLVRFDAIEDVAKSTVGAVPGETQFFRGVEFQILAKDGEVLVDSDQPADGRVNLARLGLPSASLVRSAKPGYVEESHRRRHVPVVTGYARTRGIGEFKGSQWGVLVRLDRSDILTPIWDVLWKLGLAGAFVWVPMLGLLLWTARRVQLEGFQTQQESERARAAEATLRHSEERMRTIVDAALDAVVTIDETGAIIEWNPQAEKIFGWSRQEAMGKPLAETVIPLQYRAMHERGLRRFLATGEGPVLDRRVEIMACHRSGDEFPVELTISAARLGTRYVFNAFVRDITERKQAERRQATQLAMSMVLGEARTLPEAAPRLLQAICDITRWEAGSLWMVDRVAGRLRCEEVWYEPSLDGAEFMSMTKGMFLASGVGLPGRVWASGEPVWIPDVAVEANFPRAQSAERVGLHGALGFPIRRAGEVLGVLEFFSREIRPPDTGLLQMMAEVSVKISQFAERVLLEEQLRQAQKMEAVGLLAGGIAHDFNNLLTVINGYGQILLNRLEPDSPLRNGLQEIQRAGERAATLTGQLLAYSRRQILEPRVLDLNEVVAGLEPMLRRLIGENIHLVALPGTSLGAVRADPGQIEQVIVNLVVNARDAMPKGGQLTIETANVDSDKSETPWPAVVPPGSYVKLTVGDTGCGMDAETQAHIFDPFFTTKEQGKGTGLGLALVYGIVKQSGGYIFVGSAPQQGSRFSIYLPRETGEAPAVAPEAGAVVSYRGEETILLVEDEDAIRTLLGLALRAQGYQVLEAREAEEALRINRQHPEPIHLLLTDVVMPGISGRELAERLAPLRPRMRVLYMSGYTDEALFVSEDIPRERVFLQKPFMPDVLVRRVRALLDVP